MEREKRGAKGNNIRRGTRGGEKTTIYCLNVDYLLSGCLAMFPIRTPLVMFSVK